MAAETSDVKFHTEADLRQALERSGVECANVTIAIDLTKSNTWTGKKSFSEKSLHYLNPEFDHTKVATSVDIAKVLSDANPYQYVMALMTSIFKEDTDRFIEVFAFGDSYSTDTGVTVLTPHGVRNVTELLSLYKRRIQELTLAGPTTFAPAIYHAAKTAIDLRRPNILIIIGDGALKPVSSWVETVEAIVLASNVPMDIIFVGVGDGPWDDMKQFDDWDGSVTEEYKRLTGRTLPRKLFDNFNTVILTDVIREAASSGRTVETQLLLSAFSELPYAYRKMSEMPVSRSLTISDVKVVVMSDDPSSVKM